MTIYVDAMGGDFAPLEIIKGTCLAVQEFGKPITMVGDQAIIRNMVSKEGLSLDNITIIDAKEMIGMDEEPATAVKKKKDSSLVVAAKCLKDDTGSVMISAGSTGAVLTAALLYTGRIKGIQRPALCTLLPGKTPTLLIDNGANAECKPEYLLQFAIMGSAYMQAILGVNNPRVALVNIGAEDKKGNALYKETFPLLQSAEINFVGNLEPKYILGGEADVVVCDGFTGNIILKTLEGCSGFIFSMLKDVFMKSTKNKLAAGIIKNDLKEKKNLMDPNQYGGVPLLGINGGVIKAHGNSNAEAFKNAIKQAIKLQENNVVDKIIKML